MGEDPPVRPVCRIQYNHIYGHAISVNKRNYFPHKYLGTTLTNEDKLDEAVVEFKKALNINPLYPEAHIGLGYVLCKKELFEKAIEHFKKALRASSSHVGAHCYMAKSPVKTRTYG